MKAIYLESRGAYRNQLHSDTLFGLLCWAIREVFSEARLVELLKAFAAGRPPFLISSAFPCAKDGSGWKPFLPRPLLPPQPVGQLSREEAQRLKRHKRLRYIPAEHFNQFLQGIYSESSYYASGDWEALTMPVLWRTDRWRSTIDRLSDTTDGEGTLFAGPEYRAAGGLYFLLDGDEAELVENALRFLEDFGWGGGNSVGYGHFAATVGASPLGKPVAEPDRFVTLSLYHPRPEELDHFHTGEAWYELMVRKGKVGGHFLQAGDFWKRSVLMFAPGSTFPARKEQQVYGRNPIVKGRQDGLPFDVQQFGYAFAVGMKSAKE